MLFDAGLTAIINAERTHVIIQDASGKEQIKIRFQEPDLATEEQEISQGDLDNSMLALEMENQA